MPQGLGPAYRPNGLWRPGDWSFSIGLRLILSLIMTSRSALARSIGAALMGLALAAAGQPQISAAIPPAPAVLTNVEAIVSLPAAFPLGRYQGMFRGVVVYTSVLTRRLYVQNGNHCVQVNLLRPVTGYHPGHLVEVSGPVEPSLPFARLYDARAEIIGEVPLPEPKPASLARLAQGEDAFRLVTVRLFVRNMVSDRNSLTLTVSQEEETCEAIVAGRVPLPRDWLDAEIELQGIAYPFFSDRRQPTYCRLHAQSISSVRLLKPGITNMWDRPTMTIAQAREQQWNWQQRIKVSGVVTAHHTSQSLFIEDGTGPMRLELLWLSPQTEVSDGLQHDVQAWFQPGDRVEAIGVRHGPYSLTPRLIHTEVRRIGKAEPMPAYPVTIADLRKGTHAGRVVSIDARLLDQRSWKRNATRRETFVLEAGEQVFQAVWESELPEQWSAKPGSYVRITGVNDASRARPGDGSTFQLLVRSPADVISIPPPPLWTHPEIRRGVLIAAVVGGIAAAFILFQRFHLRRLEHRVASRTTELSDANARLQREVNAREDAEAEVRVALESERELNQLKSSFISMVTHEFRTPLEVILSSSHILDRYLDRLPAEERSDQLRAIRTAVHRMSDLMEDVLTLGKFEGARMRCAPASLDLQAFCRRCADEIESATQHVCPIEITLAGLDNHATADESLLSHIVLNLLSNAVKYSPAGQTVHFTVTREDLQARIVVRDSGRGIPESDLPRLFTAFHRAHNVGHVSGSGLGLVIVKRCVDLHGGTISCESREGVGTTFTIVLPLYDSSRLYRRPPVTEAVI